MKTRRLLIGGAAAGLAATVLFLGGALHGSADASSNPVGRPPAADDTATQISKLQDELQASRNDVDALDGLGLAYQQRARETGDPTYYTKSAEVLRRALRLAPRDLLATSGLGSLALSRHRFREALALGRRARAISPTTARNYGVIGDALVELGRYRQGFQAFDTMSGLRPDVSSYSRVAHARLLLGDVAGARSALQSRARRRARPGQRSRRGPACSSARPRSPSAGSRRRARRPAPPCEPSRATRRRTTRWRGPSTAAGTSMRRSPPSRKR